MVLLRLLIHMMQNKVLFGLKISYLIILTVLFFSLTFSLALAHDDEHGDLIVQMSDDGFSPKDMTIKTGDTIIFENIGEEDHWPASNIHPTHSIYSEFDPRTPVLTNESWSFTFEEEGEWQYHDHLFPRFIGTITVNSSYDTVRTVPERKSEKGLVSFIKNILKKISSIFSFGDDDSDRDTLNTEFKEPVSYNASILNNFTTGCESNNHGCISNSLKKLTREYGPALGIDALTLIIENGSISRTVNDHQLSHEIGRETARVYGVNSEAFLLCPMSAFNGGCQHGFFEYVLGKTDSSSEAAELICSSLDEGFSSKFKFYCYHGVGHGVMMAEAYALMDALDTCNTFEGDKAKEGCWQGVFMENTNAGTNGTARENIFSDEDPLAPCNTLDNKYRTQCYLNHAGYLMHYFRNDTKLATESCLHAEDMWVDSGLQSIGLMVTNPVWQGQLLSQASVGVLGMSTEEKAWEICKLFPEEKQVQCVLGGVDNIINFDELDVTRANSFCSLVRTSFKESCYRLIGLRLLSNVTSDEDVEGICNELSPEGTLHCFDGAQIR
jgi:plastocyanin